MKRWVINLLTLLLLAALGACDGPVVVVDFAAPFPAGATDLPGFLPRHQGLYVVPGDTTQTLQVGPTTLVSRWWLVQRVAARVLDSLGWPRRPGRYRRRGQQVYIQALAADSFQLAEQQLDTLFRLGAGRLRRYRGWYYLNQPLDGSGQPGGWVVTRMAVAGPHLYQQSLRADSLRLRALDADARQLSREGSWLFFTLQPQARRATHQVSSYAGLWEAQGEYLRQARR